MRNGFTLVELSIVLVIIGLLIGGILAGQSMIQTAKINRQVQEMQQHVISITNFYNNYKYVPGDMPSFAPPGNGDGRLEWGANGGNPCAAAPDAVYSNLEVEQFWAQLSKSKMLSKDYEHYSPVSCGGTHNNFYSSIIHAGVIWPYTEITGTNEQLNGTRKAHVSPGKSSTQFNLYISYLFDPGWIVPLDKKLGASASDGAGGPVGTVNIYGLGRCSDQDDNTMLCSNSAAVYGMIYSIFPF